MIISYNRSKVLDCALSTNFISFYNVTLGYIEVTYKAFI